MIFVLSGVCSCGFLGFWHRLYTFLWNPQNIEVWLLLQAFDTILYIGPTISIHPHSNVAKHALWFMNVNINWNWVQHRQVVWFLESTHSYAHIQIGTFWNCWKMKFWGMVPKTCFTALLQKRWWMQWLTVWFSGFEECIALWVHGVFCHAFGHLG
jgi:hypothetical protein